MRPPIQLVSYKAILLSFPSQPFQKFTVLRRKPGSGQAGWLFKMKQKLLKCKLGLKDQPMVN